MAAINIIPAVEARVHLGEIMKRSYQNGERFIVEKSGIPMVVILSADEYRNLLEERAQRFEIIDSIRDKAPELNSEQVEKDILKTLRTIRKSKKYHA